MYASINNVIPFSLSGRIQVLLGGNYLIYQCTNVLVTFALLGILLYEVSVFINATQLWSIVTPSWCNVFIAKFVTLLNLKYLYFHLYLIYRVHIITMMIMVTIMIMMVITIIMVMAIVIMVMTLLTIIMMITLVIIVVEFSFLNGNYVLFLRQREATCR